MDCRTLMMLKSLIYLHQKFKKYSNCNWIKSALLLETDEDLFLRYPFHAAYVSRPNLQRKRCFHPARQKNSNRAAVRIASFFMLRRKSVRVSG